MTTPRGFTLLIAVILSSVILAVGAALFDVTYKQVVLSETAQQSQIAFYNADSALECALYLDQNLGLFDYSSEPVSGTASCQSQTLTFTAPAVNPGVPRKTTFYIPCDGNPANASATVTILKYSNNASAIYSQGFNTCDSTDTRRIERGEKAEY